MLSYLAKEEWHLPCEIVGLLAGTNSAHNGMEKDTAEGLRYAGRQASYLYSQEVNRDIWKFHDAAKGHNLLWELLLSSSEGSLKGFYLTGNGGVEEETGGVAEQGRGEGYEIRLGKAEELHARAVEEIQSGILDFLEDWLRLEKAEEKLGLWSSGNANANDTGGLGPPGRAGHEISGADVYAVMKLWCDEANKGELERLFDEEGI